MTTFKQFLFEQDPSHQQLQQAVEVIVRDCKPVLDQVGRPNEYSLYRGIKSQEPVIHKRQRFDRQPRDTMKLIHDTVNRWFKNNYGIAYRSASFAVIGRKFATQLYGTLYMVFPIGDFQYLWSPQLHDIGIEIDQKVWKRMRDDEIELSEMDKLSIEQAYPYIDTVLSNIEFKTNDLNAAIKSGSEIMVHGNGYYALNVEHFGESQIIQELQKQYPGPFT